MKKETLIWAGMAQEELSVALRAIPDMAENRAEQTVLLLVGISRAADCLISAFLCENEPEKKS